MSSMHGTGIGYSLDCRSIFWAENLILGTIKVNQKTLIVRNILLKSFQFRQLVETARERGLAIVEAEKGGSQSGERRNAGRTASRAVCGALADLTVLPMVTRNYTLSFT